MSASSLFRDIQAHTLSELLSSVLYTTSPLGPTLVPALDEHLDQTRPVAACKRGDVIEVQGPAASGKSHFLYLLLINCILPTSYSSNKLDGWGKAAVLVDTDQKFNAERFSRLLHSRVRRLLPLNPAVEAITTKALGLLHVFRPTSSHQLIATIQHLPIYLATNLPEVDLGLLAIDSITAFYWPDRYILEQTRGLVRPKNPLTNILSALRSLAQSHGPLILLSSWDLNSSSTAQNRLNLDTPPTVAPFLYADKPGQSLVPVSHHITVTSSSQASGDRETVLGGLKARGSCLNTTTSLFGTVRTPGSTKTTQFKLHITEDDIVVL